MSAMICGFSECGGSEQALVAGMDAGLLDVLHDAGDEHVLAVGEASTSTSMASRR